MTDQEREVGSKNANEVKERLSVCSRNTQTHRILLTVRSAGQNRDAVKAHHTESAPCVTVCATVWCKSAHLTLRNDRMVITMVVVGPK